MSVAVSLNEAKGFCRLGWLTRIGFGAGDLAQNLVYQTISIVFADILHQCLRP